MRKKGGSGQLERLVEPVDIKAQNKIGHDVGHNQNTPVREKDDVPGNKAREYFQRPL